MRRLASDHRFLRGALVSLKGARCAATWAPLVFLNSISFYDTEVNLARPFRRAQTCPTREPFVLCDPRLLMSSEVRVRDAVDRIMRTWSLIKLVPEQSSSGTRSSVTKLLQEHPHLTEDELVAVGLKHLYQTDGSKKQQERDFGVDETSKDSFSDEQVLECLAKAFGNR